MDQQQTCSPKDRPAAMPSAFSNAQTSMAYGATAAGRRADLSLSLSSPVSDMTSEKRRVPAIDTADRTPSMRQLACGGSFLSRSGQYATAASKTSVEKVPCAVHELVPNRRSKLAKSFATPLFVFWGMEAIVNREQKKVLGGDTRTSAG